MMTITTTTTTLTIISTNHDFLFQYCNIYLWYSRLLVTWRHCSVHLPTPSPPTTHQHLASTTDYSLTYTFFDILPWFLISIKHFWSIDYTSEMFLLLYAVIDILYKTSLCAVNTHAQCLVPATLCTFVCSWQTPIKRIPLSRNNIKSGLVWLG